MNETVHWQAVYDFWFPPDLEDTRQETHWRMLRWWMGGGANAEIARFAPVLEAARSGRLKHWPREPRGRLSLIVILDQFSRGLLAGTADAYASDQEALRLAKEGLGNGDYESLTHPWERFFFLMPIAHAEGPDHRERMEHIVALSEATLGDVPEHLRPIFEFSLSQARGHRDVIARFGRYPHRNAVLGRRSTPEELDYLEKGDYVFNRQLPRR
jgi:uncharacterized protein (DUF924 family)